MLIFEDGNFFPTATYQSANKKKKVKLETLYQAEGHRSTQNMSALLGLRLRQHLQFLTLLFH